MNTVSGIKITGYKMDRTYGPGVKALRYNTGRAYLNNGTGWYYT